jgi:YD repeat-containing protein
VVADRSFEQTTGQPLAKQPPAQRKTTLKWDDNGELTSIDMARIIDRLTQPELNRCDLDTP